MSFLSGIFANLINVLPVWQSCSEVKLSYFKDYVYSKCSCWNEIREMSVFESFFFFFEIQASLVKDPTHVIQCSPLIVLYFWKQKWPVVRLKWLFSWFFVSVLIFNLGYIFWWSAMRWPSVNFKKQKAQSQNLRIHQERLFSFLAPILLACIITSSLIHEATTLMEKLFKFWERHLSVQIVYLIKKGFLKHVMQVMVHGLWKKGKFRLKKCLRVSKT